MIEYTKRVDELEVGDVVNPPNSKSILTIERVMQIADRAHQVVYKELTSSRSYSVFEDFTYLGKKKNTLSPIHSSLTFFVCVFRLLLASKRNLNKSECRLLYSFSNASSLEFIDVHFNHWFILLFSLWMLPRGRDNYQVTRVLIYSN
jgi:hypothetical protein